MAAGADHLFNSAFHGFFPVPVHSTTSFLSGPIPSYHAASGDDSAGGAGDGQGHASSHGQRHSRRGRMSTSTSTSGTDRQAFHEDAPYIPPREYGNEAYTSQQPQAPYPEPGSVREYAPGPSPPPYAPDPSSHHGHHPRTRPILPGPAPTPLPGPGPTGYPPSAFHQSLPAAIHPQAFAQSPPTQFGLDPAPFIRQKLNMPSHIPISLASLPDANPVGSRPNVPLPVLAQVAIYESPNNRLTLKEIYAAIQDRYEYYREVQTNAWKRSIRHALSLHQVFRHIDRPVQEAGKGGYWTLDYSQGEGTKRERKRRPLPQGEEDDDDGEGGGDTEAEGYPSEYQYPPPHPSGYYSDYGSAQSQYYPPQLQHHGQQYTPHRSQTYPGHYSEPQPPTHHSPYAGPSQSQSRSSTNLYVDTVSRIKQESSPSPTPSPSSYSSHSSDSAPPLMSPTLGSTPTLRRRGTMPVSAFGGPPYPLPGLASSSYGPSSASAPGPSGYAQTGYGPPPTAGGYRGPSPRRPLTHSRSATPLQFQPGSSRERMDPRAYQGNPGQQDQGPYEQHPPPEGSAGSRPWPGYEG
ncbi:Winged helix DNA-binding domain-containing protein [Mycena chlorophos]|uniref:Winged helix DNA-binding domain-containing protein n=1 Tax=Mycena chlorophos TaxID=658473 RepID=A0A8H6TH80_MYCCL|nr:Winged helix DNA-binding domain-containing protein [Mycena chlorophos]